MTEHETQPMGDSDVFDQASIYFNQVLEKVNQAFEEKAFSVYDLQNAFSMPHEDSKNLIETLLASGLLIKEPKKQKYKLIFHHLMDFDKIMDNILFMKSVHSTNILFCDVALEFMNSSKQEALDEIESQKNKKEDGKEEALQES